MLARDKNYKEMMDFSSFFSISIYILFLSYILKMSFSVLFVILKQSEVGEAKKKDSDPN